MSNKYILDGKIPIPCDDLFEWARWIETCGQERIVQQDTIGHLQVSTIFMGLDHDFSREGPPILFETLMFTNDHDEYFCRRASTWELALENHREALNLAHILVQARNERS